MTNLSNRLVLSERIFLSLLPSLLLLSRATADVTVVLCSAIFLGLSFKNKNWEWCKTAWFKYVWVFWCYLLFINVPFSVDPTDSLFYTITFLRWPIFAAAIAYWLMNCELKQRWFLNALILTSFLIVLDTLWQYVFYTDWFGIPRFNDARLTGPFRHPRPGTLMVRVWFIMTFAVLILPYLKSTKTNLYFLLLLYIVGLGFCFITGERMAFLVFLSASIVCGIGMLLEYKSERNKIILGFLVLLMTMIGISLYDPSMTQRTIYSTIDKLANFEHSDYAHAFKTAYTAWQQYPVFGSGLHTYRTVCDMIQTSTQTKLVCSHPHNLYLHIAAETGTVGLILFTAMLVSLYTYVLSPFIKTKKWLELTASFAIMTASFFPLIGGKSVLNNWVAALVWLGVGWCLARSLLARKTIGHLY